MPSYTEVERKYDVGRHVVTPPLHDLPGVSRVSQPVEHHLDATYFDTADLDLATSRITLRRRVGGEDEGWHLKLPGEGDAREEVRAPLGTAEDVVPSELLDRIRAVVADQQVRPVARIVTRRVVYHLLDSTGRELAEFCDDDVAATRLVPDDATSAWREWETELVEGGADLLDAVHAMVVSSGAAPAAGPSKLARALGDALTARLPEPGDREPSPDEDATTGEVLHAYVVAMVTRLEDHDPLVRVDADDAVHQMRVACRRLRSVLATYRPILRRDESEPLRDELKWLGAELALARDSEVIKERMAGLVDEQPPELLMGPVAARLSTHLEDQHQQGRRQAESALDSERYYRLLADVKVLANDPPLTDVAATPAIDLLPKLLHHDAKRMRKRVRAVEAAPDPRARDLALHEVRKAAKRLRYGADSAAPVLGARAEQLSALAEGVQDALGEHQDTTVSREMLRLLGARAHVAGENGFAFGRLHAVEEERARRLREKYHEVLEEFPSTKISSWVRS